MKNPLTLEAFADWCEKQLAEKEYDFHSNSDCAFCQYLAFLGIEHRGVGGTFWFDADDNERQVPVAFQEALPWEPHTFGALASRLRQVSDA